MTERAKRAAAVLVARGWQMDSADDEPLSRECGKCGNEIRHLARYCDQCGEPVQFVAAHDSLDDIESAIAAALQE